jgi:hypothetical protein
VTRTLEPRRVAVTFRTQPAGLQLRVNERSLSHNQSVTSWQGFPLNISAPVQWVSGQPRMLVPSTLNTPATPITVTATFVPAWLMYSPLIAR